MESDLDYRSWGETRNCHGCRYWSEMLAGTRGGGSVQAVCLAMNSPNHGEYTARWTTCDAWEEGSMGAIDQPGGDPYAATPA